MRSVSAKETFPAFISTSTAPVICKRKHGHTQARATAESWSSGELPGGRYSGMPTGWLVSAKSGMAVSFMCKSEKALVAAGVMQEACCWLLVRVCPMLLVMPI